MMKQTKLLMIITLLLSLLLTASCQNTSSSTPYDTAMTESPAETPAATVPPIEIQDQDAILHLQIYDLDSVHPLLTTSQSIINFNQLLYSSLFRLNAEYGYDMLLAESYSVNEDCTRWEITLRENLAFEDGSSLTSADVLYTWNLLRRTTSVFSPSQAVVDALNSSFAQDSRTFVLEFSSPQPQLLQYLCFPVVKNNSSATQSTSFSNRPVGSGMYTIDTYTQDEDGLLEITLTPNPRYFGTQPTIAQVVVHQYKYMEDAVEAIASGEIDIYCSTDGFFQNQELGDATLTESYASSLLYLVPNLDNAVMTQLDFRKFLITAIDRSYVEAQVMYGGGKATDSIFYPTSPYYSEQYLVYDHNSNEAARYLSLCDIDDYDDDGLLDVITEQREDGSFDYEKISLRLLANKSNDEHRYLAEYIQDVLADYGIESTVTLLSGTELTQAINRGEYDILVRTVRCINGLDIYNLAGSSEEYENLSGYVNDSITELLCNAAAALAEGQDASSDFQEIQNIIQDELPIILIARKTSTVAVSPKLRGVSSFSENLLYWNIEKWYKIE